MIQFIKKNYKKIIMAASVLVAFAAGCLVMKAVLSPEDEKRLPGNVAVFVGEVPITEYSVVCRDTFVTGKAGDELIDLIYGLTGLKPQKSSKALTHTITLKKAEKGEGGSVSIHEGQIVITGATGDECMEQVHIFANRFLGYAFAGTDREYILDNRGVLNVTTNTYECDAPWIEEREPIITLWKTNIARGQYYNYEAALTSDVLSYSDDALYEYVKMMGYLGYTGIQVTDMCSAWAQYGSYQYVHERLRFMADAAHSLGMKFTLWVWGAEFTGYGWEDDSVVYYDYANYEWAHLCPKAVESFTKYYTIYSELADCSDRIIMHFHDPSNIHYTEEVANFALIFKNMVKKINPEVNFGVSDYSSNYDKDRLKEVLGDDLTVYCGAAGGYENVGDANFRTTCLINNLELGVWSWNLGENEIDQLAQMDVNGALIKNMYEMSASYDDIWKPTYWSEMDSYHIANIFSLYISGRLLQDRDLEPDSLLKEITVDLVGCDYSDDLFETLIIIEDARTGDSISTFRWFGEDYLLKSPDYPYAEILEKCKRLQPSLDEMIAADIKSNCVPLPVPVSDLLKIVRTNLEQIRLFALFREGLAKLETEYNQGVSSLILQKEIEDLYKIVPNYDALIGAWGQPEALAQLALTKEFCNKAALVMPEDKVFTYYLKQYIYGEICAYQRKVSYELVYNIEENLWPSVIGLDTTWEIINSLIEDGLLEMVGEDSVKLTNSDDYLFLHGIK